MRLARYAGRVRIETPEGLLTPDAARQLAADLARLADAAERIERPNVMRGQLSTEAETGEALPV